MLRLSNLSSLDHNSKISCIAENIVGEKESSLQLDILCMFAICQQPHVKAVSFVCLGFLKIFHIITVYEFICSCLNEDLFLQVKFFNSFLHSVPPKITKLSDAIPDHHWCIPFSVAGMTHTTVFCNNVSGIH